VIAQLIGDVVDTALDRTVLPGYTRAGYWLRSLRWTVDDPHPDALRGRTAIVTGASSGLGKATAAGLARLGATVRLVVRDAGRAESAVADIRRDVPGAALEVDRCDVSDLDDVARYAAQLELDRLDVLIHNAGVLPPRRTVTAQGHELTLATHVLGPLLLTERLRPALGRAGGRVILVASGGMYTQRLPAEDPQYLLSGYRGATAYARTKRIQVALTPLLASRLHDDGISVHAMHPGWSDTPGLASSLPTFAKITRPLLRSPEQGADTAVWLAATEPAPPTGRFWHDRKTRPVHYLRRTRESEADRLQVWNYCLTAAAVTQPADPNDAHRRHPA
jgi:NAD(P)-dependent dehydrogenase (short-subunit alcohol dehydrogenase family)